MIDIENLKCNYCGTSYSCMSSLKLHCQTGKVHDENVLKSGIPQDITMIKKTKCNMIAIKNREKTKNLVITENNICKVPINNNVFIYINDFIWYFISDYRITYSTAGDYVQIFVDDKLYALRRYIYYNLFHTPARFGSHCINHIKKNPLDITIENLMENDNHQQRLFLNKSINKTSIYRGVSYNKRDNVWICS
jgi:hypothetical protein